MQFLEDGEKVICRWQPRKEFQGYHQILHGGIQATLADEIASWFIFVKLQTAGVTTRLEIDYHQPIRTDSDEVLIEAVLIEKTEKTASILVTLRNTTEETGSTARVTYFIYPPRIAERKLNYPGLKAFLP